MPYPIIPPLRALVERIEEYARLKHEWGARGVEDLLGRAESLLAGIMRDLEGLPPDADAARREPDDLASIRALRPDGPRIMVSSIGQAAYREKLEGALLARLAGCTLGAVVEGWPVEEMEKWAAEIGDPFPPLHYWTRAKDPSRLRYETSACREYTRGGMHGVPADDDIVYTLLGLLIAEEYGLDFTTEDVGRAWLKYLPMACTAEDVALRNLKAGMGALEAAEAGNPYCQWIGADIRADPWAYLAPGRPEEAAGMAYRDAYLSHRRNGIYGAMFFAAAGAAAFAAADPLEALRIGLTEIPRDCDLAREIAWALSVCRDMRDYRDARRAVDERFAGMSPVHTINNACLTVFGLSIGGADVSKVISQTVAMGLDNDCTAATAGSIAGAIAGARGVAPHWSKGFEDRIRTYLAGAEEFGIQDVVERFARLARGVARRVPG
ncbi:MAG: ADP-ribosylglycohydrolase family protein [Patescibacteria group bacterium]